MRRSGSSGSSRRSVVPISEPLRSTSKSPTSFKDARGCYVTPMPGSTRPPNVSEEMRSHQARQWPGSGVELLLAQEGVGLVDRLQPFRGRLVAAVQIRVVLLRQALVAGLELVEREAVLKVEHRHHLLGLGRRPLRPLGPVVRAVAEQAERVAPAGPRPRGGAEPPARPVPGRVRPLVRLDLRGVHAGEEIPLPVELAHMVEAEEPVLAQPLAGGRSPVDALGLAARPRAAARSRALVAGLEAKRLVPLVLPGSARLRHGADYGNRALPEQVGATPGTRLDQASLSRMTGTRAGAVSATVKAARIRAAHASAAASSAAWTSHRGSPSPTLSPIARTAARPTRGSIPSPARRRPPPSSTTATPRARVSIAPTNPAAAGRTGRTTGARGR